MTYEEYEKILNDVVANPDTAPAQVQAVKDALKTDIDTLAALTASDAEKDARIKSLQETNIKLFLSQGGKPENETEEKPEDKIPASIGKSRADWIADHMDTKSYFDDKYNKPKSTQKEGD